MTSVQPAPAYRGFYINLDRSVDRRRRFEAQLAKLGLGDRYARFPAVDGNSLRLPKSTISPGQAGCLLSHCQALELGRQGGTPVHILEDDALLCEHTAPIVEDAIAARVFDSYDILYTDIFVACQLGPLKSMKAAFDRVAMPAGRRLSLSDLSIADLSGQNFACLTSYVVAPRAIDRVLALYRQEIAAGPRTHGDLLIRDAVHAGKLRAACVFPFVTSFGLDDVLGSVIEEKRERWERPSAMVLAVLRYSFFVGRDLELARRYLDAATKTGRKPTNAHHALIVQALEFVLSGDFEDF